jgi:hypothetical protein
MFLTVKSWLYMFLALMTLSGAKICAENPACGTLIVTYQTGSRGERLDRIRFFLKDGRQHCHMYPKEGAYVDDPFCLVRMVVINDLPVGNYTLEFVIPNWDGYFEEVLPRKFSITKEGPTKIDQVIKINGNFKTTQ